jgi:hypothetical protein
VTYYPPQQMMPAIHPLAKDPNARPGLALAASIVALAGAAAFMFVSLPLYLLDFLTSSFTEHYDEQRSQSIWLLSLATANVVVATVALLGGVLLLLRVRLSRWLLMAAAVLALAVMVAWTAQHPRTFIGVAILATPMALAGAFSWQATVTRWLAGRTPTVTPD